MKGKATIAVLMAALMLSGCTSIITYITSDNRSNNTGCNAAGDGGDGFKLGNFCRSTQDKKKEQKKSGK